MDKLIIPIPDGIDAQQKAELTGWLTDLAKQVTGGIPAVDDDPEVRAEIARRIKRGMAEIEAGQGVDGREAMRRIAEHHGLTIPK